MFGRNSIARLRAGLMLTALAAALPAAVWAQWWGAYRHPMGPPPRLAAPPAPPSVSAFMSNPDPGAAANRGGASQPGDCGEQTATGTAYYVIGPGMAAYVLPPTQVGPCLRAAQSDNASSLHPKATTLETPDKPSGSQSGRPHHDAAFETATVAAQQTASGEILVDAAGMTLYVSGSDQVGESFCYADCARHWPPATAPVDAETHGDLALIARSDGARQWAFKGRPLYRWAGDKQPGDMTGDGLGSAWAVARTN